MVKVLTTGSPPCGAIGPHRQARSLIIVSFRGSVSVPLVRVSPGTGSGDATRAHSPDRIGVPAGL
jgi:hypothetical protein